MPDDLSQVTYSWNEVEVIGKKTQNGPIFRRLKKQEVTTKIIVDNGIFSLFCLIKKIQLHIGSLILYH